MKTMLKAALAATVVLSASSAARADLTQNGAVGLPLNPTAQIPEQGGVRVQANYYDNGDVEVAGTDIGDTRLYGLYAAGRLADRLEINGGIERLDVRDRFGLGFDDLEETGFALGAKYLFTRETDPAGVRIAAGVGYSSVLHDNIHAYVVATKSFGRGITEGRAPITGHLGLRFDRYDLDDLGVDETSNKVSVYGGIEIPFTRTGDISFVGELQSENHKFDNVGLIDSKFPYSASIRYRPAGQGFSASIGIQRRGVPGFSDEHGIFGQIGYTFGGNLAESDAATAGADTTTTTTTTP